MEDWRSYDGVAEIYERVHAPRFADAARDLVAALGICIGQSGWSIGLVLWTGILTAAALLWSSRSRERMC